MTRYELPLMFILCAGFAVATAKSAEPVVVPMSKESGAPRRTLSKNAVGNKAKPIVSEHAAVATRKPSSYLFWTVRLPWSPNAPGD